MVVRCVCESDVSSRKKIPPTRHRDLTLLRLLGAVDFTYLLLSLIITSSYYYQKTNDASVRFPSDSLAAASDDNMFCATTTLYQCTDFAVSISSCFQQEDKQS
jgi:hypothetical protein